MTNVNFGNVFYELRTEDPVKEKHYITEDNVQMYERPRDFPPYSELRITLQASTYWGSSPRVKKRIHSPPSLPSTPTNPRVFVTNHRNSTTGESEIVAQMRWEPPRTPNGIITAYRVKCWYNSGEIEESSQVYLDPDKSELTIRELMENTTYHFQVSSPLQSFFLSYYRFLVRTSVSLFLDPGFYFGRRRQIYGADSCQHKCRNAGANSPRRDARFHQHYGL